MAQARRLRRRRAASGRRCHLAGQAKQRSLDSGSSTHRALAQHAHILALPVCPPPEALPRGQRPLEAQLHRGRACVRRSKRGWSVRSRGGRQVATQPAALDRSQLALTQRVPARLLLLHDWHRRRLHAAGRPSCGCSHEGALPGSRRHCRRRSKRRFPPLVPADRLSAWRLSRCY